MTGSESVSSLFPAGCGHPMFVAVFTPMGVKTTICSWNSEDQVRRVEVRTRKL